MGEYEAVDLSGGWSGDGEGPGVRLTQAVMFPRDTPDLPTAVPVFIGWAAKSKGLQAIASRDAVVAQARDWPSSLVDCLRHYFDNGGGPCWVFTGSPVMNNAPQADRVAAWTALVQAAAPAVCAEPSLTLVAMPQLVDDAQASQASGRTSADEISMLIAVWQAALAACATRQDLFFVLDAPADAGTAAACIQQLRDAKGLGAAGSHAALYGPHLVTDYRGARGDNVDEAGFRVVAPCGAVLGVYGRTDSRDGVWKAPANEVLARVLRPEVRETQTRGWFTAPAAPRETETLSINLIRSFAGRGTRIWGCRTLAPVSADGSARFRYVQVRRTVSWIEASLRQICQFAVYEPNNAITWFQLRGLCNAWLRRLWLDGGLAGEEEAMAYQVLVGLNDSMTVEEVAAGLLKVHVSVALQPVAEFIDVTLVLNVSEQPTGDNPQEQET